MEKTSPTATAVLTGIDLICLNLAKNIANCKSADGAPRVVAPGNDSADLSMVAIDVTGSAGATFACKASDVLRSVRLKLPEEIVSDLLVGV